MQGCEGNVYTIAFSVPARKQFLKLPAEVQRRIASSLERIRMRPEAYVTKLVGQNAYRLRVGDYRVIIDIERTVLIILVIKVGHRQSIYG